MLWTLFLTFFKIGAATFGGGYAMLPILQREIVENKNWCTDTDLMNYFAIGQCTPGMIAVNVATFVGYKKRKFTGALCATLGMISPSVIIITLLSICFSNFEKNILLQHALSGVRICVCVLIADVIIKTGRQSITDIPSTFIFILVLGITLWSPSSPILSVILSAFLGYTFSIHKKGAFL